MRNLVVFGFCLCCCNSSNQMQDSPPNEFVERAESEAIVFVPDNEVQINDPDDVAMQKEIVRCASQTFEPNAGHQLIDNSQIDYRMLARRDCKLKEKQ